MSVIRLGTRGSELALVQSRSVARQLEQVGASVALKIIQTRGDQDTKRSFAELGGRGLFAAELERALIEEEVDLAVHSYKDLGAESPAGLGVGAVPERRDPADVLVLRPEVVQDNALAPVPSGARVGTSSARRVSLLQRHRPDLKLLPLRGNVPTRVQKLRDGEYDAIVLAAAGLDRLEEARRNAGETTTLTAGLVVHRLNPAVFVPAPTQGAVICQIRTADESMQQLLAKIHDTRLDPIIDLERRLLVAIEGSCELPFGAWCQRQDDGTLLLHAFLEEHDVYRQVRLTGTDPAMLAREALAELRVKEPGA